MLSFHFYFSHSIEAIEIVRQMEHDGSCQNPKYSLFSEPCLPTKLFHRLDENVSISALDENYNSALSDAEPVEERQSQTVQLLVSEAQQIADNERETSAEPTPSRRTSKITDFFKVIIVYQ